MFQYYNDWIEEHKLNMPGMQWLSEYMRDGKSTFAALSQNARTYIDKLEWPDLDAFIATLPERKAGEFGYLLTECSYLSRKVGALLRSQSLLGLTPALY